MKTTYIIFVIICLCAIVSSCSTSTTVMVQGIPGTEILNTSKTVLGTIGSNGTAKIKIDDDEYMAFLLSHVQNSDEYVPFALDYKKSNHIWSNIAEYVGGVVALEGLVFGAAGILAKENVLTAAGVGGILLGAVIGIPAHSRNAQTAFENGYKYLSSQRTNQDIHLTKPVFNVYTPDTAPVIKPQPKVEETVNKEDEGTTVSTKIIGQKSSKKLKDNAKLLQGTYIGSGKLMLKDEQIESYTDIKIVVNYIDKDHVGVNVVESSGEKFFPKDGKYKITKLKDGSFELNLTDIRDAKITIDTKQHIIYIHPRVNIEGDLYSLQIKGHKVN